MNRSRKHTRPRSPRTTTALARRKPQREAPAVSSWANLIQTPREQAADERIITSDDVAIGPLGLVDMKLSAEEERVLSEVVPVAHVEIKPTAQGQIYLSHPGYTRWFNRAFGRLGWSLVPASKPLKDARSVVVAYVLYIHGKPVRMAWGEQDYYESNKEQSYGDAIEATAASALRRCAKKMGVGLELWDRPWIDRFRAEHCVRVRCEQDKELVWRWRRKDSPPFWNEVQGKRSVPVEDRPTAPVPAAAGPPTAAEVFEQSTYIDRETQGRLFGLLKKHGRTAEELKEYLKRQYRIDSSSKIRYAELMDIRRAVEAPGPLKPREPGEEG